MTWQKPITSTTTNSYPHVGWLFLCMDWLSTLIWFKTKDGQRGRNQPAYIVDSLMKVKAKKENVAFETGEDFETAKKAILGGEAYGN